MFYFLNKHTILQLVLSVAMLVWAVSTIFTQMTLCPPDGYPFLYHSIYEFFVQHVAFSKVLAVVMMLLEMLFLQRFFTVNKFADNQTMMPVLFFLLFVNVGGFLKVFSPINFTVLLTTFILLYNTRDDNEKPVKNRVFVSGIIIGVGSLIDSCALGLLLYLIFSLFANRFSSFKEIMILLSGILLCYIYVFTCFFLSDSLPALHESVRHLTFFGIIAQAKSLRILDWASMGFILLSTIYIMGFLKIHYDSRLIVLRKRYMTTLLLWLVLLIMEFFTPVDFHSGLILPCVSVVLFGSMLSDVKKRFIFHDVIIVAMLALLCL